jgi:hypothetical protein
MVEAWVDSDSGFTKGCVSFLQWGDAWPAIFPIYIVLVFGSVGIAGYLAMCGHRAVGTALVAVALYLAFNIIGVPQCYAASSSWELGWWSNWIFIAFVVGLRRVSAHAERQGAATRRVGLRARVQEGGAPVDVAVFPAGPSPCSAR